MMTSPPKKLLACRPAEEKPKSPAATRRKSLSERMPIGLRRSSRDLQSRFTMSCNDVNDKDAKTAAQTV